jgi:hypothetical protein
MNSIKLLTTYAKADGGTRYLAVLSDNSIWWYMPNSPWQTSTSEGLPKGVAITHIAAYVKKGGETRYVVVLEDESIWWYMPNSPWHQSPADGLPEGYKIRHFSVYVKNGDTRYVVVLEDESIYWYMPNHPWQNSTTEGLPLPKHEVIVPQTEIIDHDTAVEKANDEMESIILTNAETPKTDAPKSDTVTVVIPPDGQLPTSDAPHFEIPHIEISSLMSKKFKSNDDSTEIPPDFR